MRLRFATAAALLVAAACARPPERGPELARFAVFGFDGKRHGTATLRSGSAGGLVEEVRVSAAGLAPPGASETEAMRTDRSQPRGKLPDEVDAIRLDGELRAGGDGLEYRARLRVGTNVDEVEAVQRGEVVRWRRQKGLAIEEATLVAPPAFIAQSLMPSDGPSGSLALWWQLAKTLPGRDGAADAWESMAVFSVRDGRRDTLHQRGRRQQARVAFGATERNVARWFVSTRSNGWTLWVDEDSRELLAVDNNFGRLVREGFELPRPEPIPEVDAYVEEELRIDAGAFDLAGTLSKPREGQGPFPAVLLVHGSGPMDRDEKPLMTFRDLAHALSARGFAVLRYDKRGYGESRWRGKAQVATLHDLAADARRWIDVLASRPDVDARCIAVAGHSEGGYIAPLLASEDPRVGRAILIAGPVDPLTEIIAAQLRLISEAHGVPEAQIEQAKRFQQSLIRKLKARASSGRDREDDLIVWLRSHAQHDSVALLRNLRKPLLGIYGDADLQVPVDQAEKLRAIAAETGAPFEVRVMPGLDHALARDAWHDPPLTGMALLQDPDRRIERSAIDAIGDWLEQSSCR